MDTEYITIGEILKPQGNKGEVKVRPLTDWPDRFTYIQDVFCRMPCKDLRKCVEIEGCRFYKNFVILKLKGINTIEKAERLRGFFLEIEKKELLPLPAGHYYLFQIIGLTVYTEEGRYLGEVDEIFKSPANDVYLVKKKSCLETEELLIPAIKQVVRDINLKEGIMTVRLMGDL